MNATSTAIATPIKVNSTLRPLGAIRAGPLWGVAPFRGPATASASASVLEFAPDALALPPPAYAPDGVVQWNIASGAVAAKRRAASVRSPRSRTSTTSMAKSG